MAETEPVKPTKLYTVKDLKEHTTEDDCWIAINGKVYDVTQFLDEHPGGFDIIVTNTGALFKTLKSSTCSPLFFSLQLAFLFCTFASFAP